eukprot:4420116-Amphidinium_carterae.1
MTCTRPKRWSSHTIMPCRLDVWLSVPRFSRPVMPGGNKRPALTEAGGDCIPVAMGLWCRVVQ